MVGGQLYLVYLTHDALQSGGSVMKNPWEEISLDDYEKHMSLNSVMQLQTMNSIMKDQLEDYPVETAAVLGLAGGNGLENAYGSIRLGF